MKRWILSALLLLMLSGYGAAQTSTVEQELQRAFQHRALLLRDFYRDEKLRYDGGGNLVGHATPGSWTLATVDINSVKLDDGRLRIEGFRVGDLFDEATGHFRSFRTPEKIRIDVELDSQPTLQGLLLVLNKIFIRDRTELLVSAPDYWRSFLSGEVEVDHNEKGERFYRLKTPQAEVAQNAVDGEQQVHRPAITPPRAVRAPDPSYDRLARKSGVQGITVLWVMLNEQGLVDKIQVLKPVGFGLDDLAVRTVKGWKFKPARSQDHPVAVHINVEVNFRLY